MRQRARCALSGTALQQIPGEGVPSRVLFPMQVFCGGAQENGSHGGKCVDARGSNSSFGD